ncbi:outer membrane protein assembly factor BamB family protein [Kitasatospora purpeofusca]|uniref:outer membrane protein assembly factor BamB family protein n=1 Tax=Kitasatospora purpeofusca TaxID=67352 RepID=UPI0037FEBD7D
MRYSTGGGGTVLEHLYGAVLLSYLLTETPVPALGDHVTPTDIRFQAKAVDDVDDIHVTGLAPSGARHRLSIGVRRRPKLTAADSDSVRLVSSYLTTVAARWPLLQSRRWSLALAVASASVPAHQLAELALAAAATGSNPHFRTRMSEPGRPGRAVLGRLDQLDALVAAALHQGAPDGGASHAEVTWRLLSRLSLVELRLEGTQKEDRSHAVGRLQHLTPSGTAAEGDALFSRLVEKVGTYAPAGATVTRQTLLADLQGLPSLRDDITPGHEPAVATASSKPSKACAPRRRTAAHTRPPRELWLPKQRLLPEAEQPQVCEGTVVVRHGYQMSAFDALTGTALWTKHTAYRGRPVVGGGAVYIADKDRYPLPRDLRTGNKKSLLPGQIVDGLAVHDRGTLYAPDTRGRLHATDTASRTRLWTTPTGTPATVPLQIAGSTLIAVLEAAAQPPATGPGQVLALDTDTGTPRWPRPVTMPGIEQWTATEHTVYLVHHAANGYRLTALDTGSGNRRWDYPLPDTPVTVPVSAGDTVYITAQDGTVHAIDTATGTRKWAVRVGTRLTVPPVIAQDRVLVASHTPGRITALHTRTGDPAWPKAGTGRGAFVSTPYPVGDAVWAADRTGQLHAWNIDTGKSLTVRYQDALWDADLQGSPTVTDGVLYFVTRGGDLRALCLT